MNSITINCILFVVITYLLTCIIVWCLPPEYMLPATFVPASVGILLTVYNKQKVRDLFRLSSLKNWSLGFVIVLVAILICHGFSLIWFGFSFWQESFTLEKVKDSSIAMILFSLLMSFAMLIVTSLGEEIGWRGYLLKNLKNQIPNFYVRAIVVGLIWAVWHIPLYRSIGPLIWEDGFTLPIICAFILAICAYSIMFTWLFEKDNSVWPVSIAHATSNFFTQIVPMFFATTLFPTPTSMAVIGHILLAISYFVVAMCIIWFDKTRGRRLSDS